MTPFDHSPIPNIWEFRRRPGHFKQIKAWKNLGQEIMRALSGGHDVGFPCHEISPCKFLLRQYPARSHARGEKMVMAQRKPRFHPMKRTQLGWHNQNTAIQQGHNFLRAPWPHIYSDCECFHQDYLVKRISGMDIVRRDVKKKKHPRCRIRQTDQCDFPIAMSIGLYIFDAGTGIWCRAEYKPIGYSDGEAVESSLLAIMRQCGDVSSRSKELLSHITDWPSEYHLSLVRHNLLRFLDLGPARSVLELGCGCGAISRFLGESGATVVAVEGSNIRAEIAAERCRDLSNVRIYCDNLVDFQSDEKFDYVTLIGVLEYAPKYITSGDPVASCLERARSFLKDDGALVLAIENQLGLKYFSGCAEDHTGIPYYGIQDRYGQGSPVTFGRHSLRAKLDEAGFNKVRFFYPFPDYKLPSVILSQEAINHPLLNTGDLLSGIESRNYSEYHPRAFRENRVWPLLARNGLLADMANSFLVLANRGDFGGRAIVPPGFLASCFATDRHPAFITETRFEEAPTGIRVVKQRLIEMSSPAASCPPAFHFPSEASDYHSGRLLISVFQQATASSTGAADLAEPLKAWLRMLMQEAYGNGVYTHLPGRYLDCIPRNLLLNTDGSLIAIDLEWHAPEPIPIAWVLVRGLADCILSSLIAESLRHCTVRELIQQLAAELGHPLDSRVIDEMALRENVFQEWVAGHPRLAHFSECLDLCPGGDGHFRVGPRMLQEMLQERIRLHESDVALIKSSISWKVTRPLRLVANLPRLIRRLFGRP
jgi:SAM-dependent methyltransferase